MSTVNAKTHIENCAQTLGDAFSAFTQTTEIPVKLLRMHLTAFKKKVCSTYYCEFFHYRYEFSLTSSRGSRGISLSTSSYRFTAL